MKKRILILGTNTTTRLHLLQQYSDTCDLKIHSTQHKLREFVSKLDTYDLIVVCAYGVPKAKVKHFLKDIPNVKWIGKRSGGGCEIQRVLNEFLTPPVTVIL